MIAAVVPPGAPTVDSAGPLLPTLDINIKLCLFTASEMISHIRLPHQLNKTHQTPITISQLLIICFSQGEYDID